jgi:vacuolar-type H+-ATPase subunit H
MRDVIKKIIVTEAEAKKMTLAARAEAERILAEAHKRAQELTAAARSSVQLEANALLATEAEKVAQEKQERLALALAGIEKQINLDEPARRQSVAAVVRCICGVGQTVSENGYGTSGNNRS